MNDLKNLKPCVDCAAFMKLGEQFCRECGYLFLMSGNIEQNNSLVQEVAAKEKLAQQHYEKVYGPPSAIFLAKCLAAISLLLAIPEIFHFIWGEAHPHYATLAHRPK